MLIPASEISSSLAMNKLVHRLGFRLISKTAVASKLT